MHPFDTLGDPVRRRILELLATGEQSAGDLVTAIGQEFGISQPAVSKQLRTLRENSFAVVRVDGARRIYSLDPTGLEAVETWLAPLRSYWTHTLDALATEVARTRRERQRVNRKAAAVDRRTA